MLGVLGNMRKLTFIFIFLIVGLCFVPEGIIASSYKTQKLKYNISVDIPLGWKILQKNVARQLDNMTEALSGRDQSNNEILLAANCYTQNEKPSATFRISVRNKAPAFTQEELASLTENDFKYILYEAINNATNLDKKIKTKTDIKTLKVFTANVDGQLALVTAKNVLSHGKYQAHIFYLIPMHNYSIKIYATFNWDEENLFEPIMKRILSSIKIGKNNAQAREIEENINSMRQ